MKIAKQLKKLVKTMTKADECTSREQARRLIKKADKIQAKLQRDSSSDHA